MSQTASLSLPPQFILVTEAFTYKASDKDGDCLPRDTNPSWAMYRIDQAALDARQHHFNESARTHAIVRPPYRAGLTAPVGYGAVGEGAYLDAAAMQHLATQPVLTEIKASPTGTCTEREGSEPEREFACIITHECHYKPEKEELYVFAGEPPLQDLQDALAAITKLTPEGRHELAPTPDNLCERLGLNDAEWAFLGQREELAEFAGGLPVVLYSEAKEIDELTERFLSVAAQYDVESNLPVDRPTF